MTTGLPQLVERTSWPPPEALTRLEEDFERIVGTARWVGEPRERRVPDGSLDGE